MKNVDDWVRADRSFLWHPFTQQDEWTQYPPIIVERAEDFFLIDVEGKRYLDGVSSIWCNVHGHGHRDIVDAMKSQLDRVAHSTLLGLSHTPAIELAERLVEITPTGLGRVFFSDSGSTAVEVAVRMAFQYWRQVGKPERTKFLSLSEAYHGDTLGSVSLGFSDPFHRGYESLTFDVLKTPPPFLCPPVNGFGPSDEASLQTAGNEALSLLRKTLSEQSSEIAGVVIEPLVQGAAGIWPQSPDFVRGVRKLCDEYDVLLVCDEVATGFGRTGTMFACEQANITPDIMCVAKGLTAGYLPVAATLTTEAVYDAFRGHYDKYRALFHGHTYGGNPLGCRAALANLDVFESESTLTKAKNTSNVLTEMLDQYISPLEHVGPVRQVGTMVGFDLYKDPNQNLRFEPGERRAHHATLAAREQGVFIRPLGDTMILMPPLNLPTELIETLVRVTAESIDRVCSVRSVADRKTG